MKSNRSRGFDFKRFLTDLDNHPDDNVVLFLLRWVVAPVVALYGLVALVKYFWTHS